MKVFSSLILALIVSFPCLAQGPYLATGIKIVEVQQHEVRIWVRLTQNEARVGNDVPMPSVKYFDTHTGEPINARRPKHGRPELTFPPGLDVTSIQGAVPGADGFARIHYSVEGSGETKSTKWQAVKADDDFTTVFRLENLIPNSRYKIWVECKNSLSTENVSDLMKGSFKTAPTAEQVSPVSFVVTTGTAYMDKDLDEGFKIYDQMLDLDPSFFVHTGDILYYDDLAKNMALARWHWQRTYSLPTNVNFHRQVSSYFIKDDHDVLVNDCWPSMEVPMMGDFTFEQGLKIYLEQVPMAKKTYRTVRWGKDLQVWMVEGRDYRSKNTMDDGPNKTIWGKKQMAWFKRTVKASDATFKILISPTPIVGPDRGYDNPNPRESKNDNHSNLGFFTEGNALREFIAAQENMYVVCGDRHWQYVSVDQTHGVREYSSGPGSNEHAGGWKNSMILPEHKYLNVIGGFLGMFVDRDAHGNPSLTARHYSVDGKILNEDVRIVE